jgi:hypothetical protein
VESKTLNNNSWTKRTSPATEHTEAMVEYYERPQILTYSDEVILNQLGPAQTGGQSGTGERGV